MKKSNLYAEKIYSDHPVALWTFDDNIEFIQQLSNTQQDINSNNWVDLNETIPVSIAFSFNSTDITQLIIITSIAYGNNLWVAGGYWSGGEIYNSTDGVTWVTQNSTFGTNRIYSVAYGNGLLVAGGYGGQLRTSTDTVTWVTRNSTIGINYYDRINSIIYSNGLWVAVGGDGQMSKSTDTVTWVTQTSTFGTNTIYSIVYGNGLWVASGSDGQLRTSTDTVTWVTQNSTFGATSIKSVAYGNGLWVAGGYSGQLRTSTNAVTWVTRNSTFGTSYFESIKSIEYGNELWIAGGWTTANTPKMIYSTDTITWTTVYHPYLNGSIDTIKYNSKWVIGGNIWQYPVVNMNHTFYYKNTILTQQNSNFSSNNYIHAIGYGNGIWVAGSYTNSPYNGQINNSTDAITWVTQVINCGTGILSIEYGNGLWVAGGQYGEIRTSTDSITWITQNTNTQGWILTLDYGNGLWSIGTDHTEFKTSTDTINWVTQNPNLIGGWINSIIFDNNIWVLGGDYGQLRTSTNAITWITRDIYLDSSSYIQSIGYGNGLWVAGNQYGDLRISTNAITWTTGVNIDTYIDYGKSIAYNDGLWIIGNKSSTDTITWVTESTDIYVNNIAYGNNLFLGGTWSGEIYSFEKYDNFGINGSFNFNSNTDFSKNISTSCFSAYVKRIPSNIYKVRIGVIIDSIEQYSEYFIDNEWNLISHTFEIPNSSSNISFFIKPYPNGNRNSLEIKNVSLGQWSEDYIAESTGFNDTYLPAQIENIVSNNSSYSQTELDSYGINPDLNGYYLVNDKEKYFKPSGIPLVFGSHQSISIYEDPNGNPSIVFPGCGFLNESGKYNNYTFEFWMKAYNNSIDPVRIIGPVGSTDGIYLEEGFISIYIGPYTKSYFVGKYNRPMLIHFTYSETFVTLMINGELVLSMDIDIDNITFANHELNGYSLDWIGIYGNDYIFPFEIDCVAIYPYLVPQELAKKHFIYGQGVEELYSAPYPLSKDTIQLDFPFAEYAYNVTYPDFYNWRSGFSINTNTNSYTLETAKYSLPSIIIKNDDLEINESSWFLENRDINDSAKDFFPYLLMNPNSINNKGSIYFDNISFLTSKLKSIFGVFRSPSTPQPDQLLMKFFNKSSGEAIVIRLDNNVLQYIYINSNGTETLIANEAINDNIYFNAGLDIDEFTNEFFFTIRNFFFNHSIISLSIGGADNENIYTGKIYGIHFVDEFFHNKDLVNYFSPSLVTQQAGVSDLLKYIGNYSLLPTFKNITMAFDIGSSCYWEDVVPLSVFGKNISSSGGYVYDLDMIQFNIDTPYRYGIDQAQESNYYYYSLISYLNLEDKDYSYFQSLGYSSYQDLESEYISNSSNLRYSTSFKSFITLQDYLVAGNKKYSDFTITASADNSKVIIPVSASISNTKYEIFDNNIIIIPDTIDFTNKYIGIHIEMKVRGTLEKNMSVKRMQLSSFAFNDGIDTKIGTKYSYPIYPKVEPV